MSTSLDIYESIIFILTDGFLSTLFQIFTWQKTKHCAPFFSHWTSSFRTLDFIFIKNHDQFTTKLITFYTDLRFINILLWRLEM